MSLLHIPTSQTATGEVKEIFEEIQSMIGMLPNGIRLWSASPEALKVQWDGIKKGFSKDAESIKLAAIIRYLMSNENECTYCIGFNGGMLMNMHGMSQDELLAMKKDPSKAPLGEKNKALLLFAIKAVNDADAVNAEDIEALKKLGITEEEMFDIVKSASHMFVVNTLFRTFKVEQD